MLFFMMELKAGLLFYSKYLAYRAPTPTPLAVQALRTKIGTNFESKIFYLLYFIW